MKKNNRRRVLILVVGCIVSGVAIWLTMRKVQWAGFFIAVRDFHYLWLIPAFAAFYLSMFLRAVRWGLLFRPHENLSGRRLFAPLMIGFAFNSILPARVGEVIRCVAVNKSEGTGIAKAFATVVAERILDGLVLLGLLALSLTIVPIKPGFSYHSEELDLTLDAALIESASQKLVFACIVLIVGVILVLIPAVQRLILAVIARLTFLSQRIRERIGRIFMDFSFGFHALKNPLAMAQIIFYSFAVWLLAGVSNIAVARGFEIPMNIWEGMAIITLVCFAIMLPAAPGYWGLYEAGMVFSLLLLGVEKDASRAFAYGLMTHLLQWVPVVVIGLFYASRSHIRPADSEAELPQSS